MYATRDDMESRFGLNEVVMLTDRSRSGQVDDSVLAGALADAAAEVDGFLAGRYSDITVLGQAHGTHAEAGRHALKSAVRDPGCAVYRPRIVQDGDADSLADTRARARKLLSDSRLQGMTLTAVVKGHRTSDGVLWQPGQRVHVVSEPHGIDGVFFLMARKLQGGEGQGSRTTLTLKEDGVWVLDAHPDKRDKKRTKRKKKDDGLDAIDVD